MRFRALLTAGLVLAALAPVARAGDDLDPLGALDAALPKVVEKVERSVVALSVEREDKPERPLTQREKMALGIGGGRIFDQRYFERPSGPVSAVVIASTAQSATLVTTIWNLRDAKGASVILPSGEKVPATIKGRDENLDVAVLVTEKPLPNVPAIGIAKDRKVGQFAVLVGRGGERLSPIVTVGNISAVGRFKGDAIQVSTRMNYGNVGGAVVDLDGNLVGIASKLTNRPYQGINSGVGFAAPVDRISNVLDTLVAGKVVAKRKSPFLGIQGDLNPLPEGQQGVKIAKVLPGGAAAKAGMQDGDVVKIFHGVEVKDFEQLRDCIEKLEVGEKVIVTVERGDLGEKDFTIELGERPEGEE